MPENKKAAAQSATRSEPSILPGLAERDIAFIERYATDLGRLARAMRKGDRDGAREAYHALRKIEHESKRIRLLARRAFSHPTE